MATVTCRTEGCASAGVPVHPIALTFPDPDTGEAIPYDVVLCGACNQQITDIA